MSRMFCGVAALALAFGLATSDPGLAGDDGGKGKGKGKSGDTASKGVIQIDLSKLPPELAKQLMKYIKAAPEDKKSAKMEGKGKGRSAKDLPPGLARKPANHPGRVNWLRAHADSAKPKEAPPTKGKGKGKGKKTEDED